ncbi:hypothetical protein JMUB6875_61450 [Nocardia sp. JMUB6875]|uniref:hypothetical protein n=1 Tax=Nocardia sp. JMUB6875 TaxID=3158170 RepID=UPI0032E5444B
MPTVTTRAAARAGLLGHFDAILRVLPAEVSLALRHPDLPKAVMHGGVTMSWDDSDLDDPLKFLDIRYWVLGSTPETSDRYFDLVIGAWQQLGWETSTEDGLPRAGYARTPDGFDFALMLSLDGYLSLAGSTPPFDQDGDTDDRMPARIEHPAAPR